MIDVCQHSRAFSVLKGAGGASIGYTWNTSLIDMFECYMGVIIDFDSTEYSVGCSPVSGEPNVVGDRNCLHYNWTGTLDMLPAGSFRTARGPYGRENAYAWPWYILGSGDTAQSYSILSRYGVSGIHRFSQSYTRNKVRFLQTVAVTWSWVDDNRTLIMHLAIFSGESKLFTNVSLIHEFERGPTRSNIGSLRSRQTTNVMYNQLSGDVFNDTMPTAYWKRSFVTAVTSEALDPFSKSAMKMALLNEGKRVGHSLRDTPKGMWGDLTDEAVQNARSLDINSFEYLRDLYKLRESCEAILLLLRGKPNVKKLADAWLSFKYGFRLTILDSMELGKALGHSIAERRETHRSYSVCRAMDKSAYIGTRGLVMDRSVVEQYNLKIYYSPDSDKFLSLCRVMMDWDTFPSLQNIWDWIPLSFVIDWFTEFNRTLERIDTNTYVSTVNVISVIQTLKSSIQSIPAGSLFLPGKTVWSGCLDLDIYSRNLSTQLTLPLLRLGSPEEFHNIAELTAIIIQKWRR